MQENSIKYLKSLKPLNTDSPFVKLVVNFLLKYKEKDLSIFPAENKIDRVARINTVIQQLMVTRISKDDAELRNACIEAGKNIQQSIWRFSDFKQDLTDIIQSEVPLVSSKEQELITKSAREKINLIESLSATEDLIQQLITDNTKLKNKVLILEQDMPVIKKEADFEKNINMQSNTEINQLRYTVARLKKKNEDMEKQLNLAQSAGFIKKTQNTKYIEISNPTY